MKFKAQANLIEINAASGGEVPAHVHLLPAGNLTTFDGLRYLVDQKAMQAILAAHARRRVDLVIDYEHSTHFEGGEAPAAGWVKELEARADGIWGRVEWTDKGGSYLAAREYRYLSPAIMVDKQTRRVLEITDLGLTNSPRINAFPPIVNKGGARGDDMNFLESLAKLQGLEAGAGESQILQAVETTLNSLKGLRGKLRKLSGAGDSADDAAALGQLEAALNKAPAQDSGPLLNSISQALGLGKGAAESEVLGAIKGLQDGRNQYSELAKELNAIKAERAKEKAEQAVEAALGSGKITPAQRDWAAGYAANDPAGFQAYVNAAPQLVPVKDLPSGAGSAAGQPPDEIQQELNAMLGISPELFAKHIQTGKEA